MTPKRNSLARACVVLAFKIAPPARRSWFAAMAAEFDHVPEAARWRFVAGCLFAAVTERMICPAFLHEVARSVLVGGAMVWAALNIRFAGRMSVTDTFALEVFGYGTALLFVVGAIATARFGYRATISLAAPLIAVLTLAATMIWLGLSPTPMSKLYLALIVEDLVILMFALALAGFAARLTPFRQRLN